jgi:hypothetical protein
MPEEAVAEAPVETADQATQVAEIAEEVLAPSPEVAPEGETGEEQPPAAEETPPEPELDWSKMSAKALDAMYEGMPEEERANSSVIKELERRAEQRAQTRWQEEQEARGATQSAHAELIKTATDAEAVLEDVLRDTEYDFRDLDRALNPDNFDSDLGKRALNAVRQKLPAEGLRGILAAVKAGEAAKVGQRQVQENAEVVKEYADLIGTFTEQEQNALKEAAYKDRIGGARAMKLIVGIIRDRALAVGEEKGVQKANKNREGQKELLDRINKGQEIKNGVAPDIKGSASGDNNSLASWDTRVAHQGEEGFPMLTPAEWDTYRAIRKEHGL